MKITYLYLNYSTLLQIASIDIKLPNYSLPYNCAEKASSSHSPRELLAFQF